MYKFEPTNSSRPTRDRSYWRHHSMTLMLAVAALFFGSNAFAQDQSEDQWSNANLETLVPAEETGWSAGELDVDRRKSLTADMESAVNKGEAGGGGTSVYILISRIYSAGDKMVKVSIDTSDMRSTSIIGALWNKEQLREQFAANGMFPYEHGEHHGLSFGGEGQRGRVIQVGHSGVLTLECSYNNCRNDLDAFIATLDFGAIEQFVTFDHRN